MTAQIVSIGDEILIGQTLDTNSHFIAKALTQENIEVISIQTIPDTKKIIVQTLDNVQADVVIFTGGLGPTKDDLTKVTLTEYFDSELILNEKALQNVKALMEKVGRKELNELNIQQAYIPKIAKLLPNKVGTASGMWIEKNNRIYIFLPGIPYEMKYLMQNEVLPQLSKKLPPKYQYRKNLMVFNIPESELAIRLDRWEKQLPPEISVAYLPTAGIVKMRLTFNGSSEELATRELNQQTEQLKSILGNHLISTSGENLVEILGALFKENQWTISTAESFTSGRIITQLTSISGSSEYTKGGLVPYQIAIKESILHVDPELVRTHQVVSADMAKEMALKAQNLFQSDISISTTGVAGPTTDEQHPEIGRAFVGVQLVDNTFTKAFYYPHLERNDFADWVSKKAIEFLFKKLLEYLGE